MAFVDGKEFKPLKRLLAAYFGDRPDLPLLAVQRPSPERRKPTRSRNPAKPKATVEFDGSLR
jgi:hypothetical protein